jgi:glutaredoxin
MDLYICYGTFQTPRPGGHPCRRAYQALSDAGYEPNLIKSYGLAMLPDFVNQTAGRKKAKELTGSYTVPVLVTDGGEVVSDSRKIEAWAREHPASAA